MVYRAVADEVAERSNLDRYHFRVVVDPSWEDTSDVVIPYWPLSQDPMLCLFSRIKAWHFRWDSEEEMEAYLEGECEGIIKALERYGVVTGASEATVGAR